MSLSANPLCPTFGAEIAGVNLTTLDDGTFAEIERLWHEHGLLLFRDQSLNEDDLVSFSKRFGDLEIHVRREYLSPEHEEILYVSNIKKDDGTPLGILAANEVGWHYDQIYLPRPALGSFLHGVVLPGSGGETSFADMAAVYDALSPEMRRVIDDRRAVQSYEAFNRAYSVPTDDKQKKRTPDLDHPLVRTHPYTGRRAVYACPGMTTEIIGLPADESRAVLDELFAFSVRPEFVYTHNWRLGDGVLWDNARTMHQRGPFPSGAERLMKRTTILPPPALAVPV